MPVNKRVRVIVDQEPQPEKRKRGRPKNSLNKLSMAAREAARLTGELPHEFLLRVTRGEIIAQPVRMESGETKTVYQIPDLPMRIDAAKSAAPYFAPKLSAVQFLSQSTDDELDQLIAGLASEAGIGVSASGEGEAPEDPDSGTGEADES